MWVHRLSEKDTKNRWAICSNCGPVKIKKKGDQYRCHEAVKEYNKRYGVRFRYHEPRPDYCTVCSNTVRIAYDHDHKTGQFRGWLCINCNTILGLAHDSPVRLRELADYLEH